MVSFCSGWTTVIMPRGMAVEV